MFDREGPVQTRTRLGDQNFLVSLPPPTRWLGPNIFISDEPNVFEQLFIFLSKIDDAERAGCFAPSQMQARDYVLQSVPVAPVGSLLNAYGYVLERSGVNLKPNLRLKIERAYFNGDEKSDKNYLGVSDVLFDVTKTFDGSLRFQRAAPIHYSPDSLAQTTHEGSRDLAILELKAQKHYRVLFYTHQVPTDRNFSAALIGANDTARLDSFEQAMRADPNASCTSSTHDDIECFAFRGFVTVSIQIPVELNGKPQFVDWATKVNALVPAKSRKSLKIQRQFAATYYDLKFARADANVLDLTVVSGDRLTW